jgi:putative OPT family oligopeptide transporter
MAKKETPGKKHNSHDHDIKVSSTGVKKDSLPLKEGLSHLAYEVIDGNDYPPYVPDDVEDMPEFTIKSVLVGIVIGIIFGAANAYLGLKVGLTVSASIPAAVMGVAAFKLFGKGTILEANIVQTVGSAGESVAAGVIFTIPALFMWGVPVDQLKICILALLGGLLGVLFMIPLRRYLIVKEHGKLPYPEGTACAEVLVAGESGGSKSGLLFKGLGIGALYQTLVHDRLFKLWNKVPAVHIPGYKGSEVSGDLTPELLGIGYIIGPRISAVMLAGGVLGWLVLIPLIKLFGQGLLSPVYPETVSLIKDMSPIMIWSRYIRYIGAGAVAFAGIFTLIKSLPTIIESFRLGISGLMKTEPQDKAKLEHKQQDKKQSNKSSCRTSQDLSMKFVLISVAVICIIMALLPASLVPVGITGAFLVALFSFFFVTVSSRIVGLIGSSSNPVSGMTIATLLVTCLIFIGLGMSTPENAAVTKVTVLIIGSIVCIAACIAGDTSQDLKTGFLVGATPKKQQIGEIIGVITAALVMGAVIFLLNTSYGFGEAAGQLKAPQATLMKLIVEGVLKGDLPWTLVITGMFIAFVIEMLGLPTLALAVGLYLPLELSTPIMAGGLIRLGLEKLNAKNKKVLQEKREKGILFSSGLIAGSALAGVVIAFLVYTSESSPFIEKTMALVQRAGIHVEKIVPGTKLLINNRPVEQTDNFDKLYFSRAKLAQITESSQQKELEIKVLVTNEAGSTSEQTAKLIPSEMGRIYLSTSSRPGKSIIMNNFESRHSRAGLIIFVILGCMLFYAANKSGS